MPPAPWAASLPGARRRPGAGPGARRPGRTRERGGNDAGPRPGRPGASLVGLGGPAAGSGNQSTRASGTGSPGRGPGTSRVPLISSRSRVAAGPGGFVPWRIGKQLREDCGGGRRPGRRVSTWEPRTCGSCFVFALVGGSGPWTSCPKPRMPSRTRAWGLFLNRQVPAGIYSGARI